MRTVLSLLLSIIWSLNLLAQESNKPYFSTDLSNWAHYLASDHMKGRSNGSPEMEEAALFIEKQFKKFGLSTLPGYTTMIQEFSFSSRRAGKIEERNVIAYLEGSDPELKNEFIIYSAHYDHVGIGRAVDGDSIYNGANDNVAGTVTIMGLARYWFETGQRPKRSVIFAAYAGEEMGMQGSRYFSENLPFESKQIFLNFNMEMTGHCQELGAKRYYITGPSYTNFDELLEKYNKDTEWRLSDKEKNADRLLFASDNVVFAVDRSGDEMKLNIPAHTLCTHGGEPHIHRPHDEPEFMNYDNMMDLVQYLGDLGLYLGELEAGSIQWDHKAFEKAMTSRRR